MAREILGAALDLATVAVVVAAVALHVRALRRILREKEAGR